MRPLPAGVVPEQTNSESRAAADSCLPSDTRQGKLRDGDGNLRRRSPDSAISRSKEPSLLCEQAITFAGRNRLTLPAQVPRTKPEAANAPKPAVKPHS